MNARTAPAGRVRVVAAGVKNLDANVAAAFRARGLEAVEDGTPVVLDLSGVEFADSSGLGALRAVLEHGQPGTMALAGVSPRLQRILVRIPARLLLPRHGTVVEAAASLERNEVQVSFGESHTGPGVCRLAI